MRNNEAREVRRKEGCLFEERRGANNIWDYIDSNLRLSPVLKFKC